MKLRLIIALLFLSGITALGLWAWNFARMESGLESEALAVTASSFTEKEEIHHKFGKFISWEKSGGQISWQQISPGTRDFGTYGLSSYSDERQVPESGHVRLHSRQGEVRILICRVAKFSKGTAHVMIRAMRYPARRTEFARDLVVLSCGLAPSWEGRPIQVGEVPPGFLEMPLLRVEVGQPYESQRRLNP